MKIKYLSTLVLLSVASAACMAAPQKSNDEGKQTLQAFPAAKTGQQRVVIQLPALPEAQWAERKVELRIGKEIMTDGINHTFLTGEIKPKTLQGWGYTYYETSKELAVGNTLMAVPDGAKSLKKWVSTAPVLLDYNPRLPIVVYLPESYEVKYRLWQAAPQWKTSLPEKLDEK